MPAPRSTLLALLAGSLAAAAATGPPYISQGGVVNAASRMAPQLPGSPIAPGSLFTIRGVRLGPREAVRGDASSKPGPLAGVSVEVVDQAGRRAATLFYVEESRILARMPQAVQAGELQLIVSFAGQSSAPYTVQSKASSFGIFARQPWPFAELPGELREPAEIVAGHGKTIRLTGTGLGNTDPPDLEIRIGGKKAKRVPERQAAGFPGVDVISFEVPPTVALGCQVPVLVGTGGTWSNTISIRLEANGRPCSEDAAWISKVLAAPGRAGVVMLLRFVFQVDIGNGSEVIKQWDSALADFSQSAAEPSGGSRFSLPPAGTCVSYTGVVELGGILNPPLPGEVRPSAPDDALSTDALKNPFHIPITRYLDAGPYLTIHGRHGEKHLERDPRLPNAYLSHIGGEPPAVGVKPMPMFLNPGKFVVSGAGGKEVGGFSTPVSMPARLEWTNRLAHHEVTRSQGVTVTWRRSDSNRIVVIVAAAADRGSGAAGMCICATAAGTESFAIPPEALANLPATDALEDPGRPVTGLVLASFPSRPEAGFRAEGLEAGHVISSYVTGQPVSYR